MATRSRLRNQSSSRTLRKTPARRPCLETLEDRLLLSFGFGPAASYPTAAGPTSVAVGDFNRDGKLDLAVANHGNGVSVLLNTGNGAFGNTVNWSAGNGPVSVAVADFNGDGKLDLAVANSSLSTSSVTVRLGDGNGNFPFVYIFNQARNTQSIAVGDFNSDGKPDLVLTNYNNWSADPEDGAVTVLLNTSTTQTIAFSPTTYQPAGGSQWNDAAVGDLNGDGKLDLLVADDGGSVVELRGNGNGTFGANRDDLFAQWSVGQYPANPLSIAVADFNRDGKSDFAVATGIVPGVDVFKNIGDGQMTRTGRYTLPGNNSPYIPRSLAVGDFNRDTWPDLVLANGESGFWVLESTGNGTFASPRQFDGAGASALAVSDFNGDGLADLAVAEGGSNRVLVRLGVPNTAPTLSSDQPAVTGDENRVTNSGTFDDTYGRDKVTLTASVGSISRDDAAGTWKWSLDPLDHGGPTPVTITATDSGGLATSTTFNMTVTDITATIHLSGYDSVHEGSPYALTLDVTDPGRNTASQYIVHWGDGVSDTYATAGVKTHVYPDGPMTPTITVDMVDENGLHLNCDRLASRDILNAAPTITALTIPANADVGNPILLSADASDPAGALDPLTYAWTIKGPDSSFSLTGKSASFTPQNAGPYSVRLQVSDDEGGSVSNITPGLVSWWGGEHNASDYENVNHGTLAGGVTYAPGKVGQAFQFDGTGGVEVPDSPDLYVPIVTLEAWIKPSSLNFSGGLGTVIAKGSSPQMNYGLFVRPDGGLRLELSDEFAIGGNELILDTPPNLIPVGQFSHVAGVIGINSSSSGDLAIYINGQEAAYGGNYPFVFLAYENSSPLTIGCSELPGDLGFKGVIDEAAIFNRTLSQAEVLSIVNNGKSPMITVTVPPPQFTSPNSAFFTTGYRSSIAVDVDGDPLVIPSLSASDQLPSGVLYDPTTGILSGTPATGTAGGVYTLHFTATNAGGSATQTFTLSVPTRAATAKLVQDLYQLELGRNAGLSEVAFQANALDGSGSQAAIVSGIVNSTEARIRLVAGWFQTYLGRTPSTSETSFWAGLLAGQSEEQVASQLLGSTEFFSRAQGMGFGGTANQNYVRALYKTLMGRTASTTEVDAQVNAIGVAGIQSVALGLLQSIEYRANVVRSYYINLLGRTGGSAEVASWVNSSADLRSIRVGIESSQEFFNLNARKTPTITSFTVPSNGIAGDAINLNSAGDNPAGNFYPLTHTWTITRPDGVTLATLSGASVNFTPTDGGNYDIRLTVSDEDGLNISRTATDAIAIVPPTVMSAEYSGRTPIPVPGLYYLTVSFSQNVKASLTVADFQIHNTTTNQDVTPTKLQYDFASNTAVLTFAALPDGNYTMTVLAVGVTNGAGIMLDGNGDGKPGGNYTFNFFQLLGDMNRDGKVDAADRQQVTSLLGTSAVGPLNGDADGDHIVGFADLVAVAQHYGQAGTTLAQGNFNGDGSTDFGDLVVVAQNYGHSGRADFNGDGVINQADLDLLNAAFGHTLPVGGAPIAAAPTVAPVASAASAAIPTPATVRKPIVQAIKPAISKPAAVSRRIVSHLPINWTVPATSPAAHPFSRVRITSAKDLMDALRR